MWSGRGAFKIINDWFGRAVGDEVLQRFGAVCRAQLAGAGGHACIGRVGGEEFLVLLPGVNLDTAKKWLEELALRTEALSQQLPVEGMKICLSVGLCALGRNETLEKDFSRVDQALYAAKARGKRCVIVAREA